MLFYFIISAIVLSVVSADTCTNSDFSNVCSVSTNSGCKNGGVCQKVYFNGIQRTRCICPMGLVQPSCDYPPLLDYNYCNATCSKGSTNIRVLCSIVIFDNLKDTVCQILSFYSFRIYKWNSLRLLFEHSKLRLRKVQDFSELRPNYGNILLDFG